MSSITQLCRLSNLTISSYKTVLQGRTSWINPVQICNYTKKSAEQKLGIERPKRPLTPFFKFMTQMRPALLAKNPGITSKEAIAWSSKHWQQLDLETKAQMTKEYEKDLEDYKKIKAMYESSLTDEQKADIQRVKEEMAAAKEKRKLKAEYKELGKPKKPMSSYFLYIQSRKDSFKGQKMKEYQEKVKVDWQKLPENEKAKFEKQALELMNKYRKDLEAWELKMISQGRSDLVRSKPVREKKPASAKKSQ
ncbi:transcription factor A, mitochondrial [Leguminivora glycinivorella]|uniref:transcription factor A, mitochondrial n=1 Tax=Leguminivora glycinivorella TaxID=1035111 RepID=UPI00200DF4C3|nr:transcription factor A, mitochondrial [Leguminivora glycinivorella]